MKWKQSSHEGILVSSALVCIWMLVVMFYTYQHQYQNRVSEFTIVQQGNEAQYLHMKNQRKQCGDFHCFSGTEFVELFDDIDARRLNRGHDYYIFDTPQVNTYVNTAGELRGYTKRSYAYEDELIEYNNLLTFPFVRDAYTALRNEMQQEGISLHLVSGYRGFDEQKEIFLKKLGIIQPELILTGEYDKELDMVFTKTAPPGYSKHHTGYAVDFGCGDSYNVFEFLETECYQWMAENNFQRVKKYGFIPSYPEDVEYQGPSPEPWECVWVGSEVLQ